MRGVRLSVHTNRRSLAATLIAAAMTLAAGCSQSAKPSRDGVEKMPVAEPKANERSVASTQSTMSPMAAPESPSAKPIRSAPKSSSTTESKPTPDAKRIEFAPQIIIDWSIPRVEIGAEVALSDGLIELLLCSRGTKEHESILVTDATAQRIFEAMGLIGLTPGSPVQYDEATESFLPPRGDRVVVEIEYSNRVVGAHEWMNETKDNTPANPINWVFAGSSDVAGRFSANNDGTIVCVVNFDTALIAPDALHTSDDSALWLAVNEQRVPPVGTKCRVFLSAATDTPVAPNGDREVVQNDAGESIKGESIKGETDTGPMRLIVTPEGSFHWGDELLTPVELDGVIRKRIEQNPDQPVHLSAIPGTDSRLARVAARCIVGSGIKQSNLTLELPDDGDSSSPESSAE